MGSSKSGNRVAKKAVKEVSPKPMASQQAEEPSHKRTSSMSRAKAYGNRVSKKNLQPVAINNIKVAELEESGSDEIVNITTHEKSPFKQADQQEQSTHLSVVCKQATPVQS